MTLFPWQHGILVTYRTVAHLVTFAPSLSPRCGKKLDHESEETEMKRRRMKASISSPSPLPQTVEEMMHRRGMGNGNVPHANGYVDGMEQYGLAGHTFLGESEFIECVNLLNPGLVN